MLQILFADVGLCCSPNLGTGEAAIDVNLGLASLGTPQNEGSETLGTRCSQALGNCFQVFLVTLAFIGAVFWGSILRLLGCESQQPACSLGSFLFWARCTLHLL